MFYANLACFALVQAVVIVLGMFVTDSAEIVAIVMMVVYAWMVGGLATLQKQGWRRVYGTPPHDPWLLKDTLALVLWPMVSKQIMRRGDK